MAWATQYSFSLATVVVFVALVPTLLTLLPLGRWPLVLLYPFRAQYALGYALFAGLLTVAGQWPWALVSGLAAGIHSVYILPLWFRSSRPSPSSRPLRVFLANVQSSNRRAEELVRLIDEWDPDIVALIETGEDWLNRLAQLDERFPHHVASGREEEFGVALWSRLPLLNADVVPSPESRRSMIGASVVFQQVPVHIVVAHPEAPLTRTMAARQQRQFEAIRRHLLDVPGPAMLIGDMNATPWCPQLTQLRRRAHLLDSRRGYGLQATWPAWGWPLRIPIDHILHTAHLSAVSFRRLPGFGSDHFPVVADLELRGRG